MLETLLKSFYVLPSLFVTCYNAWHSLHMNCAMNSQIIYKEHNLKSYQEFKKRVWIKNEVVKDIKVLLQLLQNMSQVEFLMSVKSTILIKFSKALLPTTIQSCDVIL